MHDRYLGDGVYASYDGYYIWLDLRGSGDDTKIALEPRILKALNLFNDDITEENNGPNL